MSHYISDDSYTAMLKPGTELTKLTWAVARDHADFHCHHQNAREWPLPHHVCRSQNKDNKMHLIYLLGTAVQDRHVAGRWSACFHEVIFQ